MAKKNPFYEEWRACLKSHYAFVIETQDVVTEPSLRGVLLETGFTDDEITRMRDEVQRGMILEPDAITAVQPEPEAEPALPPVSAQEAPAASGVIEPSVVEETVSAPVDGLPVDADEALAVDEPASTPPLEPTTGQQLSLF